MGSRRRDPDLDHRLSRLYDRGSPATSTTARSTSSTAAARASSASSRRSARNCGCRARPSTARSTGWSAPISPTRISTVTDNLRFGNQYGRFATCRIVSGGGLAALYSPTSPGCLAARPAAFGPASPAILRGLRPARFDQRPRQHARRLFPEQPQLRVLHAQHLPHHRPVRFHLRASATRTSASASTRPSATTIRPARRSRRRWRRSSPTRRCAAVAGGLIGLSCQGNSTAELNGVSINDRRSEDEFTGTGVLSYRPTNDLLLYASYSRGYKAGGFNLDRSALKSPIFVVGAFRRRPCRGRRRPGAGRQPAVRSRDQQRLRDRREIFARADHPQRHRLPPGFRELPAEHVQRHRLPGPDDQRLRQSRSAASAADNDLSATTGACAPDDVTYGVRSQGIEIEALIRPRRDMSLSLGLTLADTKYRDDLVGNSSGVPLDPALRVLPGNNLSNAPERVLTGAFTWTPRIGNSGLTGLFYVDARVTDDYNTGSDLFPQKAEDGYAVVNARLGVRGAGQRWSVELWAQNLFDDGLCAGRVQHAVPGRHDLRAVRRSAIPGRAADLLGLPRRAADLRHHRPLPLLIRTRFGWAGPRRRRRGPFPSGGLARPAAAGAAALSSRACSAFSRDAPSIFAPSSRSGRRRRPRARHRWRYGRCGSIARDIVDGAGQLEQQGGAVAGVDLDHGVAVRRLVIDEHRGLDRGTPRRGAAAGRGRRAARPRARARRAPASTSASGARAGADRRSGPRSPSWTRKLSSAMPSSVVWMRASMMLPPARLIAPASR